MAKPCEHLQDLTAADFRHGSKPGNTLPAWFNPPGSRVTLGPPDLRRNPMNHGYLRQIMTGESVTRL